MSIAVLDGQIDVVFLILERLDFVTTKQLRTILKAFNRWVLLYWVRKKTVFKLFAQKRRCELDRFDLTRSDIVPLFYVEDLPFFRKNGLVHFFLDYPCPTMMDSLTRFAETIVWKVRGFTVTETEKKMLQRVKNVTLIDE